MYLANITGAQDLWRFMRQILVGKSGLNQPLAMLDLIIKLGAGMTAEELGAFVRLLQYQQVHGGWEPERIPLITGLCTSNAQALHKHMLTHCLSIAQALHKHYCPQFADFLEEKKSEKTARAARAKKAAKARWGDKAVGAQDGEPEIILKNQEEEKKEKKSSSTPCAGDSYDIFFPSIDQRNSIQGGTGGNDVETSIDLEFRNRSMEITKLIAAYGPDRYKANHKADIEQGYLDALRHFVRLGMTEEQAGAEILARAGNYNKAKEANGETRHYLHNWLSKREYENILLPPKPSEAQAVKQTAAQIAAELRRKRNAK